MLLNNSEVQGMFRKRLNQVVNVSTSANVVEQVFGVMETELKTRKLDALIPELTGVRQAHTRNNVKCCNEITQFTGYAVLESCSDKTAEYLQLNEIDTSELEAMHDICISRLVANTVPLAHIRFTVEKAESVKTQWEKDCEEISKLEKKVINDNIF